MTDARTVIRGMLANAMRDAMHDPSDPEMQAPSINRRNQWPSPRRTTEQPILDLLGIPGLHVDAENTANRFDYVYDPSGNYTTDYKPQKDLNSQGEGLFNDPYRHTIAAAELRRKFGPAFSWLATTAHEVQSDHLKLDKQDYVNNELGRHVGKGATDYNDVKSRVRVAMINAIMNQKRYYQAHPEDPGLSGYKRDPGELIVKTPSEMGWHVTDNPTLSGFDEESARRGDDILK